jgi:uncharacterized protein
MDPHETFRGLWRIRDHDLVLLVALLAERGIDVIRSPTEALAWCTKGAENGDSRSQHALAKLLWTGLAGPRNDGAAFEWSLRASEQGYLPAIVMLSGFYSSGIGVARDDVRAIELLRTAAERGSARAMSLLATSYDHGLGVERDHVKALALWRSAAELGDAEAQCQLGRELTECKDLTTAAEGIRWLRAAADQGHYSAHFELAHLYETGGAGLQQDKQLAEHHRSTAAALEGE